MHVNYVSITRAIGNLMMMMGLVFQDVRVRLVTPLVRMQLKLRPSDKKHSEGHAQRQQTQAAMATKSVAELSDR